MTSQKTVTFSQISHYVWSYCKKNLFWLTIVIVLIALQITLEIIMPYLVGELIDYVSAVEAVTDATYSKAMRYVILIAVFGLTFHTLHIGTHLIYDIHFKFPFYRDTGVDAFNKVQRFSADWHTNSFAGAIVTKIKRGTKAFEMFVDKFYDTFIPLFFLLIGITTILIMRWKLMGVVFIIGSFIYMAISIYMAVRFVSPIARKTAQEDTKYGAALADALSCNATVKSFGNEAVEDKTFAKVAERWKKTALQRYNTGNLVHLAQNYFMTGLKITLFSLALFFWREGVASTGDIAFIIATYGLLQAHLRNIGMRIREVQQAANDMEEIVEYSLLPLQVKDKKDAKKLVVQEGAIQVKEVSFQYENQGKTIFSKLNLEINPKQKVALVGHSGSGKSTVVKILQRLYDVQKGQILIDDQDISAVTQESLRKNIALVPQDPILFHRSIGENIAYGAPRRVSKKAIIEASKKAHAHEFVSRLPKGYDTLVGERGVKLSGGERQRIAIARAILANSPILILDEATSSLDSESERYIQDSVHNVIQHKTAIIIAHRLSTIKEVDRIIVFEDGKIIEDGSFDQLIKQKGTFAKLWELQTLD